MRQINRNSQELNGVEYIPKEKKNNIKNNYRIDSNSVICGYFCVGFIDFILKSKYLLEYIKLFSPY